MGADGFTTDFSDGPDGEKGIPDSEPRKARKMRKAGVLNRRNGDRRGWLAEAMGIRVLVRRILRKHGYPPDKQEKATQTVLEQAKLLCGDWAV